MSEKTALKWLKIGAVWGAMLFIAGILGGGIASFLNFKDWGTIGEIATLVTTGGIAAYLYKKFFRKYEE